VTGATPPARHARGRRVLAGLERRTEDPLGPVHIHNGVSVPVVFVGEGSPLLVYEAAGATGDDTGLYVFGPVPF
jgi:hypothetical protein